MYWFSMTDMSLAYLMTDLSLAYSVTDFFYQRLWHAYSASWLQWYNFVIIINVHDTALCWLNKYLIKYCKFHNLQGKVWRYLSKVWHTADLCVQVTDQITQVLQQCLPKNNWYIHIFIDDRSFILISMYWTDR